MVDWFLAEKIATYVAGGGSARPPRADLEDLVADSQARVVAYTGLHPQTELPPPEGVSRADWVRANLGSMRALLDPVLQKAGGKGPLRPAIRLAAGAVVTAEVGVLVGFMAQRVLGQYELVLLEEADPATRPPRLLFVLPNLGGAVAALKVDEDEFVRWVALHEVTHAVQFAGVPWLHGHLAGMIRELMEGMELRIDTASASRLPSMDDVKRVVAAVRKGDLMSLVARPEERELMNRVQTTMAVVEGHAEHVMDECGADVLPSLGQLREAMNRRRRSASAPARLLQRLLGLEMKLRQYEDGKRFCDAVAREAGAAGLAHVWSSPEALPTPEELHDPAQWLRRTSPPAAAA
ncbi:MAG: hypothetical protein JWN32_4141 [Solirubrobacterales bacterium]|nr:hypothetical protein [Solirubrobacterales bacterium]